MFILSVFSTSIIPMTLGEFVSRTEREQMRSEFLGRETSGRVSVICLGPDDREPLPPPDRAGPPAPAATGLPS